MIATAWERKRRARKKNKERAIVRKSRAILLFARHGGGITIRIVLSPTRNAARGTAINQRLFSFVIFDQYFFLNYANNYNGWQ